MKQLDFLVIGAAKSATTTLYELIKSHPEIYIPSAKEVPYFSDNKVYKKGMERYLKAYFPDADEKKLWGTVTPQYMLGEGDTNPQIVAERIKKELPNVKLVALLRNPAERAFSHYKMMVQRGHEHKEFEEIVKQSLTNPSAYRQKVKPQFNYIFGSEYGRILKTYYSLFPAKNILVLTTDELRDDPVKTIRTLCKFLEINHNYTPANTNKKYRQGGARPRYKMLTPGFLFKVPLVKFFWKNLTPQPIRKRVEYSINLWNTKADDTKLNKDDLLYEQLLEFYASDMELLESLTARSLAYRQTSGHD